MPSLLIAKEYRFYFYSNENNEPVHIHVKKDNLVGKIWLGPIKIHNLDYFSTTEKNK